jgi:hypothetical protein
VNVTVLNLDVKALGLGDSGSVRAEGLHASDIYNSFYADLDPKKYLFSGPINPLLVEIGLIFENMLEEGLIRRLVASGGVGEMPDVARPGEFTFHDTYRGHKVCIHYNPDMFMLNGVLRVAEIKSTWKWSGVSHELIEQAQAGVEAAVARLTELIRDPKFDKYLTQLKFYLYMLGELLGRIYIFFVVANGRPPFPSQLLGWDLDFTAQDLRDNYVCLMNHAIAKGLI